MRSTTAQTGTVSRAPATNIAPKRRTVAVRSAAGPTMKPGVSTSETTGSRCASHSRQERGGLVGGVAVDRPAQVQRVAGQQPDRVAVDAGEGGQHPGAEPGPQLQHAARVAQGLDDRAHVVAAHPVLRDEVAQHPLVGVRASERGHARPPKYER